MPTINIVVDVIGGLAALYLVFVFVRTVQYFIQRGRGEKGLKCGYCDGAGKVRSAGNPRKKIKCVYCNGTGTATVDQIIQLANARNAALNRGYCRWHGAYIGDHCPDPAHNNDFSEN